MRQNLFNLGSFEIPRGEALRCFIAAIYNTAKRQSTFTTDDVYNDIERTQEYDVTALRRACANSKLISVALRKAQKLGYVRPCAHGEDVDTVLKGDDLSHGRPKRVWHQGAHFAA